MDKHKTRKKTAIENDRRYNLTALPLPVLRPILSTTRKDRHGDAVITNMGKGYLWSGEGDVPGLGQRVTVAMNRLGAGTVVGYLVEYGWLGVKVELDAPPDWHRRQNPGEPWALVFGAELATEVVMDWGNYACLTCRGCEPLSETCPCACHASAR